MTVHQYSHALCSGRGLCCPWPKPAAYQAVAASLPLLVLSTSTLQAHHRRRQLQMHQHVKSSNRSFAFCPCQAAAVAYDLIECRAAAAASSRSTQPALWPTCQCCFFEGHSKSGRMPAVKMWPSSGSLFCCHNTMGFLVHQGHQQTVSMVRPGMRQLCTLRQQ